MSDELHWMSATDLAAAIRRRDVSSVEALDHLVARIERLDGPTNAVVQWDLDGPAPPRERPTTPCRPATSSARCTACR